MSNAYNPVKGYFFIITSYLLSLLHDIKVCLYILIRRKLYIEVCSVTEYNIDWYRKIYFIHNKKLYSLAIDREDDEIEIKNVTDDKIELSYSKSKNILRNFVSKSINEDLERFQIVLKYLDIDFDISDSDFYIHIIKLSIKDKIIQKGNEFKRIKASRKLYKMYRRILRDETIMVCEKENSLLFYFIFNSEIYELHIHQIFKNIVLSKRVSNGYEFITSWRELTYNAIKDLVAFKNYSAILRFLQPRVNTVLDESNISEKKIIFNSCEEV